MCSKGLFHAEKERQEHARSMAVNTGSLLIKRCRQAQKMHGTHPPPSSANAAVRMGKKVQTIIQNTFGGWSRSCCLGIETNGNNPPPLEKTGLRFWNKWTKLAMTRHSCAKYKKAGNNTVLKILGGSCITNLKNNWRDTIQNPSSSFAVNNFLFVVL